MLGKTKPKPMIGILTGSLSPTSNRSATVSPKPQSPKPFDLGAVGLGIVAALDNSAGEIPANRALFTRSLSRSSPIPVKNCSRNSEEMVTESFEEYRTIVTCHGPNESYTKVYGDGRKGDDRNPFRIHKTVSSSSNRRPSVFHISPPKISDYGRVPPPDFLSSCNLCHKKLHDKDIYMYRGEKAFCSTECRYRQMVVDERTDKCSSEKATTIRAVEVATSPYTNGGQMFTTGILAI